MSFLESLMRPEHLLLLFVIIFIMRFVLFSTLEYMFIAHDFERRKVLTSDLVSMFFYIVIIFPLAQYLSNYIGIEGPTFSHINDLPLALRVLLYFLLADFLHYWIHRLMHEPYLWRIHMWHHSFTHMSWMAGFRATAFDTAFVNLGFIFAWPLLGDVSSNLRILLLVFGLLLNDWMHLNVRFRLTWLEWLLVTPRYHHIHHSSRKEHYTKNLSPIFSVWDRLFSTYVDPDDVDGKLTFGINEKVSTPRLIIGL